MMEKVKGHREMIAGESLPFNVLALKEAECRLFGLPSPSSSHSDGGLSFGKDSSSVANVIASTRKRIENSLKAAPIGVVGGSGGRATLEKRVERLETENASMKEELEQVRQTMAALESRLSALPSTGGAGKVQAPPTATGGKGDSSGSDSDVDLFGSDDEEEDAERERVKQERLQAYKQKKEQKPGVIAKSSVILDVKPWEDSTDLAEMEGLIRGVQMDGLVWGASKLIPVAYGIKKVQIMCVVEDAKVSVDELTEKIESFDEFVQSVDIAAFNKI